ncbi:unnamed protein product, partial [Staurois parvus]
QFHPLVPSSAPTFAQQCTHLCPPVPPSSATHLCPAVPSRSATHLCPPVPPTCDHQCPSVQPSSAAISATYPCHLISAAYQCRLSVPFSASYQCPSVLPHQRTSVKEKNYLFAKFYNRNKETFFF